MRKTQPARNGLRLLPITPCALSSILLIAALEAPVTYAQSLTPSVPAALAQLVQQSAPKAMAQAGKRATPTAVNSSFSSVANDAAPSINAPDLGANEAPQGQAKAAKDVCSDKTSRSAVEQAPRDRSEQHSANGDRTATVR